MYEPRYAAFCSICHVCLLGIPPELPNYPVMRHFCLGRETAYMVRPLTALYVCQLFPIGFDVMSVRVNPSVTTPWRFDRCHDYHPLPSFTATALLHATSYGATYQCSTRRGSLCFCNAHCLVRFICDGLTAVEGQNVGVPRIYSRLNIVFSTASRSA